MRLYILGVEDLFQEGDRLLQVEHGGSKSPSLAGKYGEARKENGDSSKNLRMSRTSPLFHPILRLWNRSLRVLSSSSMGDSDNIFFLKNRNCVAGVKILINSVCICFFFL